MTGLAEKRVLVTPTSFARHDRELREHLELQVRETVYNEKGRPLTSEELVRRIPKFDGFIAGLDEIDRPVIEAADHLKVIARYGVGVDNVDLEAAASRGIVVCNTPGANADSVAELAIGLMLAIARKLCQASSATKSGEWPRLDGRVLAGKTVGLVGLGSIGSSVVLRLKGFNCNTLAHDPFIASHRSDDLGVRLVNWPTLLAESDILSLHCPLTEQTRGLMDSKALRQMKSGAILINTARGGLIDEAALAEAIRNGHIAGAGLDVFSQQPPETPHPLLDLPAVIATPHMGSHTDGAVNAMGWAALQDCLAVLKGEEPSNRVI
ncbi:MAG: phosphoglycerate dehydrogenase [Anaerolineales bacterium]